MLFFLLFISRFEVIPLGGILCPNNETQIQPDTKRPIILLLRLDHHSGLFSVLASLSCQYFNRAFNLKESVRLMNSRKKLLC